MADQAAVNRMSWSTSTRAHINAPLTDGVIANLAEFGNDLATLGELQAKLALMDLKASTRRVLVPAVVIAGAVGLALGSLPVVLLGLAELLAAETALNRWGSYLLVGAAALVLAAVAAAIAAPRIASAFESFERSREELARNVAWIKTVLAHSGRKPVHGRP